MYIQTKYNKNIIIKIENSTVEKDLLFTLHFYKIT